jgi:hypothetical protein
MTRSGRLAALVLSAGAAALAASCVLDWPPPLPATDPDAGAGGETSDASVTGHLYVIGGVDESDAQLAEVLAAPIFADGSWGEWKVAGALPESRSYHAGGATPKHLYALGGETFTFTHDALLVPFVGSGELPGWTPTTDFATERFRHSAVIVAPHIYVIGGVTFESMALTDVQFAPINGDGTLGGWTATTPLPAPRHRHASSTYNGFVYVLGGSADSTVAYVNDVFVSSVESGGSLGPWTSTEPFVTTRHGHKSVAANSRVYVLGGISGSGALLDDVQVATMNTDGTLVSWSETTSFQVGRQSHACTLFNNRVYIVGGRGLVGGVPTVLRDAQFATIKPDGTLGPWVQGIELPVGRVFHTVEGG